MSNIEKQDMIHVEYEVIDLKKMNISICAFLNTEGGSFAIHIDDAREWERIPDYSGSCFSRFSYFRQEDRYFHSKIDDLIENLLRRLRATSIYNCDFVSEDVFMDAINSCISVNKWHEWDDWIEWFNGHNIHEWDEDIEKLKEHNWANWDEWAELFRKIYWNERYERHENSDSYDDSKKRKLILDVKRYENQDLYFCIEREGVSVSKKLNHDTGTTSDGKTGYDYYFIVGGKTVKTDITHLLYFVKVFRFDFPIYKDYEPSDPSLKKEFAKIREDNDIIFKKIGSLPHGNYFYKYMDLESALRCMERKTKARKIEKSPNLRFVEPTSWEDQYEGRFYTACYKSDDGKGGLVNVDSKVTPFLYACCFSAKRENEAAWVLYSHNRIGLASRCVEFTLNRMKFREELVRNQKNCVLYIGAVQYVNKEKIDCIHLPKIGKDNHVNEDYNMYFRPFTKESYLNLLLLKRSAFEHEKEVRVFIVPNDEVGHPKTRRDKEGGFPLNAKPHARFVDIDWVEVIEEVRIDENCSDYEVSLLQKSLDELVKRKIKKDTNMTEEQLKKLKSRFQLKKFNPYKDDNLKDGPITIVTNQKE